jgi:hypothetical protein
VEDSGSEVDPLYLMGYIEGISPCGNPQRLEGGYINYVWRVPVKSSKSVILKHAPPYMAADVSLYVPMYIFFMHTRFNPSHLLSLYKTSLNI